MKPINRIFLFLLFISVSYAVSYAQENQSYFLHTIEKGQSLYSISKMYNVTTSDIVRLNPGCNEKIYAGQTIKIPKGKESPKGETFHTIQAGETLYKLTTMYNVSAKDICEANRSECRELPYRTGYPDSAEKRGKGRHYSDTRRTEQQYPRSGSSQMQGYA